MKDAKNRMNHDYFFKWAQTIGNAAMNWIVYGNGREQVKNLIQQAKDKIQEMRGQKLSPLQEKYVNETEAIINQTETNLNVEEERVDKSGEQLKGFMKSIGGFHDAVLGSTKLDYIPYNDIDFRPGKGLSSAEWLTRDENGQLTKNSKDNIKKFMEKFQKSNPEEYERIKQASMTNAQSTYEEQSKSIQEWRKLAANNLWNGKTTIDLNSAKRRYIKNEEVKSLDGKDEWLVRDDQGNLTAKSIKNLNDFFDNMKKDNPKLYELMRKKHTKDKDLYNYETNAHLKLSNPEHWWYNKGAEYFSKSELVDKEKMENLYNGKVKYGEGKFVSSDSAVQKEIDEEN